MFLPVIRSLMSVHVGHIDGDRFIIVNTESAHLVRVNRGRLEVISDGVESSGGVLLETGPNLQLVLLRAHSQPFGHPEAAVVSVSLFKSKRHSFSIGK